MYVISCVKDLASCFHSVLCFSFHDDNLIAVMLAAETLCSRPVKVALLAWLPPGYQRYHTTALRKAKQQAVYRLVLPENTVTCHSLGG
jgi:hypothetical protein